MISKCFLARLFLCLCLSLAYAAPAAAQNARTFQPNRMDTVLYGAAYYPEYMPADRLEKDLASVADSYWHFPAITRNRFRP